MKSSIWGMFLIVFFTSTMFATKTGVNDKKMPSNSAGKVITLKQFIRFHKSNVSVKAKGTPVLLKLFLKNPTAYQVPKSSKAIRRKKTITLAQWIKSNQSGVKKGDKLKLSRNKSVVKATTAGSNSYSFRIRKLLKQAGNTLKSLHLSR